MKNVVIFDSVTWDALALDINFFVEDETIEDFFPIVEGENNTEVERETDNVVIGTDFDMKYVVVCDSVGCDAFEVDVNFL